MIPVTTPGATSVIAEREDVDFGHVAHSPQCPAEEQPLRPRASSIQPSMTEITSAIPLCTAMTASWACLTLWALSAHTTGLAGTVHMDGRQFESPEDSPNLGFPAILGPIGCLPMPPLIRWQPIFDQGSSRLRKKIVAGLNRSAGGRRK